MLGCTRSSLEAYTTVHVMSVLKLTLLMQLLLMSTPFNVTWIQQSPECDIKRVWNEWESQLEFSDGNGTEYLSSNCIPAFLPLEATTRRKKLLRRRTKRQRNTSSTAVQLLNSLLTACGRYVRLTVMLMHTQSKRWKDRRIVCSREVRRLNNEWVFHNECGAPVDFRKLFQSI